MELMRRNAPAVRVPEVHAYLHLYRGRSQKSQSPVLQENSREMALSFKASGSVSRPLQIPRGLAPVEKRTPPQRSNYEIVNINAIASACGVINVRSASRILLTRTFDRSGGTFWPAANLIAASHLLRA